MKIVFFPLNVDAAGCYRAIFPMAYLGARGHEAVMPNLLLEDWQGRRVRPYPGRGLLERIPPGELKVLYVDDFPRDADVYVFHIGSQRWMVEWAEQLRKGTDAAIVVDLDDDLHRTPAWNPGRLDPVVYPENNRRWTQRLCELADMVTCATPALAGFYSRFNQNVRVLRNRLHWPMWQDIRPVYERREWRRVRVGYMGNMRFHRRDLEQVAAPLRKWLRAHPDVEFVAAGDPAIHDVVGTPDSQRVSTSKVWFRNLDLPYITSCMDVGLVPLVRCDFNEGKSALKGMEYAACGIPCVATPTEPYREWLAGGQGGVLARHPREFVEAVDYLAADSEARRRMGAAAHALARASSLDRWIHEWEAAYAGLCDHADAARTAAAA